MNLPQSRKASVWLFVLIGLQIVVLTALWCHSNYPLYFGEKVLLGIEPVDPRSLFRGQFVRLNYQINEIDHRLKDQHTPNMIPAGTTVFVSLKQTGKLWEATRISTKKPRDGHFIRGQIHRSKWRGYRIRYGIEAYFAEPEIAKKIETDFQELSRRRRLARQPGPIAAAEVMLAPNGQATLVDIHLPS